MFQTINFSQFCDSFNGSVGSDRSQQFTYDGKRALFDYLEELEESTGGQMELDPIALCSEFTEYESLEELQKSYPNIDSLKELEKHTTVIRIPESRSLSGAITGGNFIIQDF